MGYEVKIFAFEGSVSSWERMIKLNQTEITSRDVKRMRQQITRTQRAFARLNQEMLLTEALKKEIETI